MGKSQKTKGRDQEYVLRDHLRMEGWESERVPMSGASSQMKGDVWAKKADRRILFEMKSRKDSFKRIYELYYATIKATQSDVFAVAMPCGARYCVTMSSSLDSVLAGAEVHEIAHNHCMYKKYKRTFGKISNLEKLLGTAEILAIKDDRKPLLFLRFQ